MNSMKLLQAFQKNLNYPQPHKLYNVTKIIILTLTLNQEVILIVYLVTRLVKLVQDQILTNVLTVMQLIIELPKVLKKSMLVHVE